jgi:hypothetical protein
LHNTIKYHTVEDAVRAVGQAHARLGGVERCKDHHGGIDVCIQRQIKAYAKTDDPLRRVKPVPIIGIVYILHMAYDASREVVAMAIANLICIAFFFILRPGVYMVTTSDDKPFHIQDVGVYIRGHTLDVSQCSDAELNAASSVPYTFTTQ